MTHASSVFARGFARTPIAALDSELSGWHPVDLAAVVVQESLGRAQLTADGVDELIAGCAEPVGAQGADVARAIVLSAGWPARTGGLVIDRAETSGMTALHVAAASIRAGHLDRVMVVGLGLASTVPPGAGAVNRTYGAPWGEGVAERMADGGGLLPAPRASEAAAIRSGITREELDARADASLSRRRTAPDAPAIVSVAARPGEASPLVRPGDPVVADGLRDWGPAADLPPAFDTDGLTTAATFAPPADAVTALVLDTTAGDMELQGVGRAAGEPDDPTGNVTRAVELALSEAGLELSDIELIEVTETSASTLRLVGRSLGLTDDRLNRHGGALATGDAGAAEELRLVTDAVDRLDVGQAVLAVSAGLTGSAATVWRRLDGEVRTRP